MLSGQSTNQTMHVLVCWKAWRWPVADWPYIRAFQMTVVSPHCLCGRSVLASNVRMLRRVLVHDIIRSLGDAILQGRQIRDRYCVINMNPRCSELPPQQLGVSDFSLFWPLEKASSEQKLSTLNVSSITNLGIYKIGSHMDFELASGSRQFCTCMQVWPASGRSVSRFVIVSG